MNTSWNDTDFQARHEHYRDMLRAADANIALRRGELRPERHLPTWLTSLPARLLALVRRPPVTRPSGEPCLEVARPC